MSDSQRELPPGSLPPVSFASFVASLAASALHSLGHGSGTEVDLEMARHTIDILSLLEQKTKGNLDPEEQKLLETLLYEARMRFVEASGAR